MFIFMAMMLRCWTATTAGYGLNGVNLNTVADGVNEVPPALRKTDFFKGFGAYKSRSRNRILSRTFKRLR